MKRCKQPFLLIEILICLSLMGLLLGVTVCWQSRSRKVHEKNAIVHKILGEENIFYKRLRKIYEEIREELITEDDEIHAFLFNRGISKNPELSGIMRGALIYNEEEQVLKLRVTNPKLTCYEEINLLSNVLFVEDCVNTPEAITLSLRRSACKPFKERTLVYLFLKCRGY